MTKTTIRSGMDWFPHSVHMSDDAKMDAITERFGQDGYAIVNRMLEQVYLEADLFILRDGDVRRFAYRWRTKAELVVEVIEFAVEVEFFDRRAWEESRGLTSSFIERIKCGVQAKREAGKRGGRPVEKPVEKPTPKPAAKPREDRPVKQPDNHMVSDVVNQSDNHMVSESGNREEKSRVEKSRVEKKQNAHARENLPQQLGAALPSLPDFTPMSDVEINERQRLLNQQIEEERRRAAR